MAKSTARKQYRTMRGRTVDVDQIVKKNELTPAVGNARVNARGDQLGPGGKIIKKREDLVKEHYEAAGKAVRDTGETESKEVKEESKPTPKKQPQVKPARNTKTNTASTKPKAEKKDDWVEDSSGNFVKKEDK